MLFVLEFPIVDLRPFLNVETGFLRRPFWPVPTENKDFIRSFGGIKRRSRGGLTGWVGESLICDVKNAIKFPANFPFEIVFRHFYFDGHAVGKFEIGVSIKLKANDLSIIEESIETLLNTTVAIKDYKKNNFSNRKLIESGDLLANLYLYSSSKESVIRADAVQKKWVQACSPLGVCEQRYSENVSLPLFHKKRIISNMLVDLSYNHLKTSKFTLRLWNIKINPWGNEQKNKFDYEKFARETRIYLLRLHAEQECLKRILTN